jgi:hypothetical protein
MNAISHMPAPVVRNVDAERELTTMRNADSAAQRRSAR